MSIAGMTSTLAKVSVTIPAVAAIFRKFAYIRSPSSPLFSGWNCVATTLSRATTDGKVTP